MSEEENVISPDVAMSTKGNEAMPVNTITTTAEVAADSEEEGALSDGGSASPSKNEENVMTIVEGDQEQPSAFVLAPDEKRTDEPVVQASTKAINDDGSNSEGQISTDNEDEEDEFNPYSSSINNGFNRDINLADYEKYNRINGNKEYIIPSYLLVQGEYLENRLIGARQTMHHIINQLCMFNERLLITNTFDIDEFTADFVELGRVKRELIGLHQEYDRLYKKISVEALRCLDKYEANAAKMGGSIEKAKMNKSKLIRNLISSWDPTTPTDPLFIPIDPEDEKHPRHYYDNCHGYQLLSRKRKIPTWNYTYEADIPPAELPSVYYVAPTVMRDFPMGNVMAPEEMPMEEQQPYMTSPGISEIQSGPPISALNPKQVELKDALSVTSSPGGPPPMISQGTTSSFDTAPKSVPSAITAPATSITGTPPSNFVNATPPSNEPIIPMTNTSMLHKKPQNPSVLIPGLNIANTAPLFAQAPSGSQPNMPGIPSQIPPMFGNMGNPNFRKPPGAVPPLINMNLGSIGTQQKPAPLPAPQPSSSSHIPSLLSIEVPFPIEILKRQTQNAPPQNQSRKQNRARRSPADSKQSKDSKETLESTSQDTPPAEESMDTTEAVEEASEAPMETFDDTPDGVYVQPAIYFPIRSVNGFLTYYPHPVSASMTPPIPSYYTSSPLTLMSGGAVSPIPNGSMGEGPAQMRKLFIGGLNHETTDDQLREYYSQWGVVVDCIVIRDPVTKQSRGFGFVTYATIQMAEVAMNGRPHTINGKVVDPKRAIPREQMLPMTASNPPYFLEAEPQQDCKIILTGIHWDYHTVDGLRQHFETFGSVEQVEILGHPRGFGFVVFEDKDAVTKCKAHGKQHSINGKKVDIKTDPSLDLPSAASVYSKRRHNLSGSQGYATQQHSSTATPDSICSTEYTSSGSVRSDQSDTNNMQTTPTF